ncbi:unnamed protein product [Lupinus luteus]|uniref:Uncharacterized protein n=1 Tax=Lupinus luteus TaxID=3873 RepID=A0AAV1Y449_LUPLU
MGAMTFRTEIYMNTRDVQPYLHLGLWENIELTCTAQLLPSPLKASSSSAQLLPSLLKASSSLLKKLIEKENTKEGEGKDERKTGHGRLHFKLLTAKNGLARMRQRDLIKWHVNQENEKNSTMEEAAGKKAHNIEAIIEKVWIDRRSIKIFLSGCPSINDLKIILYFLVYFERKNKNFQTTANSHLSKFSCRHKGRSGDCYNYEVEISAPNRQKAKVEQLLLLFLFCDIHFLS